MIKQTSLTFITTVFRCLFRLASERFLARTDTLLLAGLAACSCLCTAWAEEPNATPSASPPGGHRIVEQEQGTAVLDERGAVIGWFVALCDEVLRGDDRIEWQEANLIRWQRTFALRAGQPKQRVRLTMDFLANHRCRFACIPGISWDGNVNDPGNVYHGFAHEGTPWSFAWHRTLIPGATYSEGDRYCVGLFAEVRDPAVGLSCSLVPGEHSTIHRLIVPEEEQPQRVLIRERGLSPGRAQTLELAPGESYVVTAWLVVHPLARPKLGYRHLLDAAWSHAFHETYASHHTGDIWTMGVRFAKESLWDERARMFHLALRYDDKLQWSQAGGFSIGWCGRNGELACALLVDYLDRGDTTSRDMAIDCLDAWVRRVDSPPADAPGGQGVPREAMAPFVGTWTVTYNNGAVVQLRFRPDGQLGSHPSWGVANLRVAEHNSLACDWSNGQRERYRMAEGRLVVEHVFEGVTYTGTGTPAGPLARFQHIASDANTLSDGASALLHAFTLARRCGVERPEYRDVALSICDAALALQQPDGRFEGAGCERGGIGAAFIPPLLTAYEMTHQSRYLSAAQAATKFYMQMLYCDGCLWGGALDTRSIDKETALPLITGTVRLYELTKDPQYLIQAEDAAYYFVAWQIAQTIPNPPGSLMDAIDFDTFGGTSVATVHMCADPFGVSAVPYLLRLGRHTGREIWEQRARALWNNATQGISDGTLSLVGLPPRPCGSQDETVNYTDWGYDYLAQGMDRDHPRGAGQGWLTAWPTAMRLTILSDHELRRLIATWPVQPAR